MNTELTFRFVTRTFSEDYRVFGNGGKNLYSDSSEFEPLRKKGRIIPEEGPCAVIYQENGLIFCIVSSMQRGTKDFANRPIRFSFCKIFTDKTEAWSAFTRVISDFKGAEKIMQSLIREERRKNADGEDVDFQQEKFMSWLQRQKISVGDAIQREGDFWPYVWPPEGAVLKWTASEDDQIFCVRSGGTAHVEQAKTKPVSQHNWKKIAAVALGAVMIGSVSLYVQSLMGKLEQVKADLKKTQENLTALQSPRYAPLESKCDVVINVFRDSEADSIALTSGDFRSLNVTGITRILLELPQKAE